MTASYERRYRRLLWAYPGSYRRRHGAEIMTTLLEMAEAGHGRPARWPALHLVACGVRQRFRLPARRPLALVAALLAAVAVGALGAAGGTWLGWQTAASVPSDGQMRSLAAAVAGSGPGVALYPDGRTAMQGPMVDATIGGNGTFDADRVRRSLTADGWRTTRFTESTGAIVVALTTDPWTTVPTRDVRFAAEKAGLKLTGDTSTVIGGAQYGVDGSSGGSLTVWAQDNGLVRPLAIAGMLLGLLAGWLLAAAVAGRLRQTGRSRRWTVAAIAAAGFAAAVVPAFSLYRDLYEVMRYDTANPNPYIVISPSEEVPATLVWGGTGIALLALVAAAVIAARGRRADVPGTRPETSAEA